MYISRPSHAITFLLPPIRKRRPKLPQPNRCQHTQPRRQGLKSTLHRPGDATPRQHHACEQSQFHAVGRFLVDAVAAEQVEGADGAACGQRGDRTGADVAGYAPRGGEGSEDEGDC